VASILDLTVKNNYQPSYIWDYSKFVFSTADYAKKAVCHN